MKKLFLVFLALLHVGLGAFFIKNEASGTDAAAHQFPLDDSWILLVYARGMVEHGGPYYNDDEMQAGFSSPLWMLAATGLQLAHRAMPSLDLVALLKWFGVAIAFLASWAVFALAQRLGAGIWGAGFAAFLHALSPQLAFSQVSGMEVALAGGLAVLALIALHDGAYTKAGWAMALAYWTRPEMGLLFVLLTVLVLLDWKGQAFRERRGDFLRLAGPFVLLAAIWAATCYAISGGFLPTTAAAKFRIQDMNRWGNFFLGVLWPSPSNFLFAGTILLLAGYWAWLRRPDRVTLAVMIFPWLFFFAVALTRNQPRGVDQWFYFTRYGLPALPLLFVAIGAGLHFLWQRVQEPGNRRLAFRAVACALGVAALVAHPQALQARAEIYSRNCKNVEELQVRIGRWIEQNTPPDAAISSHDAGALRYFGKRKLIDLMGLNDYRLARDPARASSLFLAPEFLVDYMKERGSRWLVMTPTFFPRLTENPLFPQLFETVFEAESAPNTLGGNPRHSKMVVWKLR